MIEPKAIVLAEGAATVLLGDLLLLYGWASILQGPKIYIAEGLSYEMQWYNFFKIGVYGEERIYWSNYDTSKGLYQPWITSNSPGSNSMNPHYGAWNPNVDCPW